MNESTNKTLILEKVSRLIVVALAFLVPVFFLPTTTEFFQFNKLALVASLTILLLVLWAIRIVLGQRMEITRSSLDIPLLIFTGVVALSTIFSIQKSFSIYGSQGRWFPSLFGMLTMIVFYYAAAPLLNDRKTIRNVLMALVAGGTVSTLVALLAYFGVFLGSATYLKLPNFTLVGSVTLAALLAGLSSVLALMLSADEKKAPKKIFLNVATILNFAYVVLANVLVGWVVLLVGLIGIAFFFGVGKILKDRFSLMLVGGASIAILLVTLLPATSGLVKNASYPREIVLPLQESWVVATSTIQDYPLLATGPSTYQLNFTRYRPLSLNTSGIWNVRFDRPYNEIFSIISTLGLLGAVAAAFLAYKLFVVTNRSVRSVQDESGLSAVIAVAIFATLASFLVTYASVTNAFILFLLLVLMVANHALLEGANLSERVVVSFAQFSSITTIGAAGAIKKEFLHILVAVPMLALAVYSGYLGYRVYAAEYYMRQSIVSALNNQASKTYDYQARAININPQRDTYHSSYAQTNLALANILAAKQDLTNDERATIQTLIAQAIRSSRVSTELANPLNVANWETRALIYRSLIGVAQNAPEWAISTYNTAVQLDPTNPSLRLDLGGVYYAAGDYLSAANFFRQAVNLKPDYANAHYNFAQSLLRLNDFNNAKRELEVVKSLVPAGSADARKVEQEIASIQDQPAVAGAQDKPTVEELVGPDEEAEAPADQEPLTEPGEQPEDLQNVDLEALPPRERGQQQPAETQPTEPAPTQPAAQ
jgi:tetratricopeptide (TPR) repeat protein